MINSNAPPSLGSATCLNSRTLFFPSLQPSLVFQCRTSCFQQLPIRVSQSLGPSIRKVATSPISDALEDDTAVEKYESDDFVQVGLICSTHGVKGEVKVISRTDFPEQRFEQPGIRWVGFFRMGKFVGIRKVNLVSGRKIIQGKEPAWLLSFEGFETVEKSEEILGATVLIKSSDKPGLSDDQFYIPDLIGMSVLLKESGEVIGNVVDVFNSGASDLLRVKMNSSNTTEESKEHLVWIPFAEEIVPIVDKQSRQIEIVPPKGLLELNRPSKKQEKQELRKEALKAKRKLQERLSGVRKRLAALNQGHVLSGLSLGDEHQKETLRTQLLDIDFKLLKHAVETTIKHPELPKHDICIIPSGIVHSIDWKGLKVLSTISPRELQYTVDVKQSTWNWWRLGLQLVSEGKVAIVIQLNEELEINGVGNSSLKSSLEYQIQQLLAIQNQAKLISKEIPVVPLVLVTTEATEERVKNMLIDESYFGLPESQVMLIKSSYLPYISCDVQANTFKILMESQWELIRHPAGEGHTILDLDDSGILNSLIQMDVRYIHVCGINNSTVSTMDSMIFGLMEQNAARTAVMVTAAKKRDNKDILCLQDDVFDENECVFSSGNYTIRRHNSLECSTSVEEYRHCYKIAKASKYTYSVDYLLELSKQRYEFLYEGWSAPHMKGKSTDLNDENPVQLKCPPYNALLFCDASKVALFERDSEVST